MLRSDLVSSLYCLLTLWIKEIKNTVFCANYSIELVRTEKVKADRDSKACNIAMIAFFYKIRLLTGFINVNDSCRSGRFKGR